MLKEQELLEKEYQLRTVNVSNQKTSKCKFSFLVHKIPLKLTLFSLISRQYSFCYGFFSSVSQALRSQQSVFGKYPCILRFSLHFLFQLLGVFRARKQCELHLCSIPVEHKNAGSDSLTYFLNGKKQRCPYSQLEV